MILLGDWYQLEVHISKLERIFQLDNENSIYLLKVVQEAKLQHRIKNVNELSKKMLLIVLQWDLEDQQEDITLYNNETKYNYLLVISCNTSIQF